MNTPRRRLIQAGYRGCSTIRPPACLNPTCLRATREKEQGESRRNILTACGSSSPMRADFLWCNAQQRTQLIVSIDIPCTPATNAGIKTPAIHVFEHQAAGCSAGQAGGTAFGGRVGRQRSANAASTFWLSTFLDQVECRCRNEYVN